MNNLTEDTAAELTLMEADAVVREIRERVAANTITMFQCEDCGEDLLEGRRIHKYKNCVDCQQEKEKLQARTGKFTGE